MLLGTAWKDVESWFASRGKRKLKVRKRGKLSTLTFTELGKESLDLHSSHRVNVPTSLIYY